MEEINMFDRPTNSLILVLAACVCFFVSAIGWQVDFLCIEDGEKVLLSVPVANGYRFVTEYIHSVELTPVEDEYAVVEGSLWNWQERVKSSNAGMPSLAPEHGKYINTPEWLIFQGGRKPWERFYLRVGDARFGRNKLFAPPFGKISLYERLPGRRLAVSAFKAPLFSVRGCSVLFMTE